MAVARHLTADSVGAVADGLLRGGVLAFELTLNDPEAEALAALEAARRHAEGTRLTIGAGTILSIGAAQRAVDAGAAFLVLPHTDVRVVGWALARGIPVLPGAFTPTEVLAAWQAGATAVKLFPASVAGRTLGRGRVSGEPRPARARASAATSSGPWPHGTS